MQTIPKNVEKVTVEAARRNIFAAISRFLASPAFAYLTIALLVLKVMWGVWDFKDIDWGDTISYYQNACQTFERGRINLVWSPIFAIFGSLLLHISFDPYFYCVASRMICVTTLALLALSVMRRMLPPTFAWLAAAWWVVLPVNFNTLYPVHLFGAIPIVTSWLLLLLKPNSRWMRGAALAFIAASGILVRNEQTAYAVLLGIAMFVYEARQLWLARKHAGPILPLQDAFRVAKPYLVPLLMVAVLVSAFYMRSIIRYPDMAHVLRHKHTNNIGQIFCFGFQQRYPGVWTKDPWTQYGELMTKYFGEPELTITEALVRNPPAMIEHLAWNASLIPSGLQLMLFNQISGPVSPDYIEPVKDTTGVVCLSVAAIAVLIAGVMLGFRQRAFLISWASPRSWTLTAMGCYSVVALIVMVMQRPRTSYVFPFAMELMGIIVFSLWLLLRSRLQGVTKLAPLVVLSVILLAPSFYVENKTARSLLGYIRFMEPLKVIVEHNHGKVLVPWFPHELAYYLYGMRGSSVEKRFITINDVPELKSDLNGENYLRVLDRENIHDVFFDEETNHGPSVYQATLAQSPQWRLVAYRHMPDRTLSLYTQSKLFYAAKKRFDQFGR